MLLMLLLLLPRTLVVQRLLVLLILPLLPLLPLLQRLVLLRGRGCPIGGVTPTVMGMKRAIGKRPEGGRRKWLAQRQRHNWSVQPWQQRYQTFREVALPKQCIPLGGGGGGYGDGNKNTLLPCGWGCGLLTLGLQPVIHK